MVASFLVSHLTRETTGSVMLANGQAANQAVVYFEGNSLAKPLAKATVNQARLSFSPHVSVVTVGTTVTFPNNDTVFHNVFAEFHSARFDFGMYPKGTSKKHTFDRTGLAVIMCSIHPNMSAYVMVVDTPYYAVTDSKGQFNIPDLPAGSYKAFVWHESGEKAEKSITYTAGSSVELKTKR